jgi:hypothetical protein
MATTPRETRGKTRRARISEPVAFRHTARSRALAEGYRSGLEASISKALAAARVPHTYEGFVLPYEQPAKNRRYTPDYALLKNGIVVESKGRFVTADRQKHLLIQAQYPELELRFVFSAPNTRISKQSQTTYAAWCETHGFLYAAKSIPQEWINEAPHAKSLALVQRLLKEKKAR